MRWFETKCGRTEDEYVYLSCSSCSASSFSSSSSRAHSSSSVRMPFLSPPSLPSSLFSSSSSFRSSTASSLGLEFGLCAILRFPFEGDKWKWVQLKEQVSYFSPFSPAKNQSDGAEKLSEIPLATTASLSSTSLISTKSPFIWKEKTKRPHFRLTQHFDCETTRGDRTYRCHGFHFPCKLHSGNKVFLGFGEVIEFLHHICIEQEQ